MSGRLELLASISIEIHSYAHTFFFFFFFVCVCVFLCCCFFVVVFFFFFFFFFALYLSIPAFYFLRTGINDEVIFLHGDVSLI